MNEYDKYMKTCFKLAQKGTGKTSPNPLVGCVVLDSAGNIISTGYHKKYGENHAERDALLKLDKNAAKGGTLIVNLEPCNHFGKTPPCTDIIIEYGIKRVVISSNDTNPKAAGGIKRLQDAGIEVIQGVLEKEGNKLNEVFFTNINQKRTFVALKTATTIDGKIASSTGDSKWITTDKARKYAYKLRKQYDAILTSSSTVIADNPKMVHKNKIIIDRHLRCDFSSEIFKQGKIYLFTQKTPSECPEQPHIEFICNKDLSLQYILNELYNRKIMSVFVEAGGKLSGAFLKDGLIDKLYHFTAPKILNDNTAKSAFDGDSVSLVKFAKEFRLESIKKLEPDVLLTYTRF